MAGDLATAELIESRVRELYLKDRDCPLSYEPSGEDFLSPCLAEADLARRVGAAGYVSPLPPEVGPPLRMSLT